MAEYLLVGGAGFIGSALIHKLGEDGVQVMDNFSPIIHDQNSVKDFIATGVDFIVGDVVSRDDIEHVLKDGAPKILVYLAAETGTGRSLYNCSLNARVNTLGLANVLDAMAARETFPERIVLTSTRAVYGEGPYRDLATGDTVYPLQRDKAALAADHFDFEGLAPLKMNCSAHTPNPNNIYGTTKLSQEHLLLNWASSFDVPLHIFRLQNVYGAGQSLTNPYTGVLIHFIKRAMANESTDIYENGGITRDFVHVDDVATLLAKAVKGDGPAGSYDCGSGVREELSNVAALIASCSSGPPPVLTNRYRLGDVRHACADITRIMADFDWSPQVSLEDGIADLCRYVILKLS